MLKPLTLSLSLAVALGFCSVSMAGGHGNDGCTTCGLASPQGGPIASPQGPIASGCDVGDTCGRKKCSLFSGLGGHLDGLHCRLKSLCNPPVTYEWVLKKKRLWGHHGGGCNDGCGDGGCGAPSMRPARLLPRARVAMPLRRASGGLRRSPGCTGPHLWCWPARLSGGQAGPDHRLGSCRDDPGRRRRGSSSGPGSQRDQRPAPPDPLGQLSRSTRSDKRETTPRAVTLIRLAIESLRPAEGWS